MLYHGKIKKGFERFHLNTYLVSKGAVIIYGRGWHRREKGWVNKILSE